MHDSQMEMASSLQDERYKYTGFVNIGIDISE